MQQLAYLFGQPEINARFKVSPEDFRVQEDLGYTLDGEGEHLFVYLRKRDNNTQFVAEQLAKFVGIPAKLVSYAGLKDRFAVTEQWFGLHLPGKSDPDLSQFDLAGCDVLHTTRHLKKLRIGGLKGNHFIVTLRQVDKPQVLESRLVQISQAGVPNYFAQQRFGHDNHNLHSALAWAKGEIKVKDRKKRSFYLSAARSAIFNAVVSERILRQQDKQLLTGDIVQLAGRGSWFCVPEEEKTVLQQRVDQGELRITAPLVGDSPLATENEALAFEQECLAPWQALLPLLQQERLTSDRRALLLCPQSLRWQWQDSETVTLQFWLPAGSYATSVLRELIIVSSE